MAIGRTVWGPKVPTLKGTEVSLYKHVQCFLYLASSSINVSIHFILHGWIPSGQASYILNDIKNIISMKRQERFKNKIIAKILNKMDISVVYIIKYQVYKNNETIFFRFWILFFNVIFIVFFTLPFSPLTPFLPATITTLLSVSMSPFCSIPPPPNLLPTCLAVICSAFTILS